MFLKLKIVFPVKHVQDTCYVHEINNRYMYMYCSNKVSEKQYPIIMKCLLALFSSIHIPIPIIYESV